MKGVSEKKVGRVVAELRKKIPREYRAGETD